jgi:hypothetical protein
VLVAGGGTSMSDCGSLGRPGDFRSGEIEVHIAELNELRCSGRNRMFEVGEEDDESDSVVEQNSTLVRISKRKTKKFDEPFPRFELNPIFPRLFENFR